VFATLSPIVESTNSADHTTVSRNPASTLRPTIRPRRRGYLWLATGDVAVRSGADNHDASVV
jgi:hypothetical protein